MTIEEWNRLFSVVSIEWTRGNWHKLRYKTFDLNIRKYLLVRVVKRWNRLPRRVMESPFLEIFKT